MQIAKPTNGLPSPPRGGVGASDLASQISAQRAYHRAVLRNRAIRFWWPRILLIVIFGVTAAILSQFMTGPLTGAIIKYTAVAALAIPVVLLLVKRLSFALFVLALVATPFAPVAVTIKSLAVFPCIIVMILLFLTLMTQVAFHLRKAYFPSIWVLWPYLGMIFLAILSTIVVQFTWTHGVPKKINSNPIYYDEILGIGIYFFPVMTYLVVTTIASYWEKIIKYILNGFLFLCFVACIITFIEFRRFGGNINTFRFSDPHVFWMSLRALAQLMALGSIIAYARFIYSAPWRIQLDRVNVPGWPGLTTTLRGMCKLLRYVGAKRVRYPQDEIIVKTGLMRTIYGILTVALLGAIIVTLQNSWWIEVGVALVVITIVASWRLLLLYGVLALPFIPLIKAELTKLQSVKADDFLRFIIWQDALRVWSKQPLLGVGPGDFWAYDQVYTRLPRIYRNCNATGLCVAHNGYLQTLGEVGPVGLALYIAATIVVIIAAVRLYNRFKMKRIRLKSTPINSVLQSLGLYEYTDADLKEKRTERTLALIVIGLACGSLAADFFIGEFMLPPRQVSAFNVVPQIMVSWTLYGLVMYKDQVWRMARKAQELSNKPKLILQRARPPRAAATHAL